MLDGSGGGECVGSIVGGVVVVSAWGVVSGMGGLELVGSVVG